MNEKKLTNTFVVSALALFCCLLWGSAFPCIKIGYGLFNVDGGDTPSQLLFAGVRFTLAGFLVIIISSIMNRKLLTPKKESAFMIFKLSMVQTVMQYVLFYIGLAHTSGVKSSIINASNVFLALIFSVTVFKYERLTLNKVIGCIIGFIGVIAINITKDGFDTNMSWLGEGAVFFSAVSYALSSGLIKKYSQKENAVALSGYQFLLGGIIMTVIGLCFGGRIYAVSAKAVILLLYLAFISAAAYTIWGILLKYNDLARIAVFGFTNPVFGVILSAVLLNESEQLSGANSIISVIAVCVGIYLVNKKTAKQ